MRPARIEWGRQDREGTGMTQDGEGQVPGTVTALRRPPVRQSVLVRSDQWHTFDTFVDTIGIWWPVTPFSAGKDRVRDVTFERRQGGRVFETWQDGTEVDWGEVLVWEPPARFVMTWNMAAAVTEVELTFFSVLPALPRAPAHPPPRQPPTDHQHT